MPASPDVAVVGHIEWVEYARVERVPEAGEIVHARETWEEAAGGGAVAAVQLAKLAGRATLFTAVGDDELGRRAVAQLEGQGVHVEAARRGEPTRRAFTFVDDRGERTITVIGDRMVPRGSEPLAWADLARFDAVYLTGGDATALRAARAADLVVATARIVDALAEATIPLDALVRSASDEGEAYRPGDLDPPPRLVVATEGARGGRFAAAEGRTGAYEATPLPGPISDAYGCGDSFAGGLTFGLATEDRVEDALAVAARCGAACLTGRGAYEGQLRLGPRPAAAG